MRPARILAVAVMVFLPTLAAAQVSDTLVVGERVRVRVAPTSGSTNQFIGTIGAISSDTLVLETARGKGTITLPRTAIREVAKSDGHASRWRMAPFAAPIALSTAMGVSLLTNRHASRVRPTAVMAVGFNAALLVRLFSRTPPERWTPVESWLSR